MSTMVKVNEEFRNRLKRLATKEGISMQAFLERMLRDYEDRQFFQELQAAYERLRADEKQWAEHKQELDEWDGVLADGLENWESP